MQRGESALQIAVRKGHLDVVKVLVQVYRDSHMESEVRQFYLDLAHSHHHEHVVKYLSREFPSLKRKVRHPPLICLTYSCISVWAHHLACLGWVSTHCLCSGAYTLACPACRCQCYSRSHRCIPTCGLYLDLVTQTTNAIWATCNK